MYLLKNYDDRTLHKSKQVHFLLNLVLIVILVLFYELRLVLVQNYHLEEEIL